MLNQTHHNYNGDLVLCPALGTITVCVVLYPPYWTFPLDVIGRSCLNVMKFCPFLLYWAWVELDPHKNESSTTSHR